MLQFSLVPSMCVRLLFILFLIIANNRSYGQSDAWVIHTDTFSYGEGFEFLAPIKLLEENNAIHNLWKSFNPIIHKKRRTFSKEI